MTITNAASSLLLPALLLAAGIGAGCITIQFPGGNSTSATPRPTAARTPPPMTPGTVNGKTISADMSDEEILAAFDVDKKTSESEVSRGPDGYTTSYKFGDQKVSITRSVVSGVSIFAHGEPIKGDWKLGGGI